MRIGELEYMMEVARAVSRRSTCDRLGVGAVLIRGGMILSTGYNGSVRGAPHCDEVGHLLENGHCVRTVHAELNALLNAARNGVCLEGSNMVVTHNPCMFCMKAIANAGIRHVRFGQKYGDFNEALKFAKGIRLELVPLYPEL